MSKTQKESQEFGTLDGQITLDDVLANVDDGTYGKPADEFVIEASKELRV